jgi:hypothetical protein
MKTTHTQRVAVARSMNGTEIETTIVKETESIAVTGIITVTETTIGTGIITVTETMNVNVTGTMNEDETE